MTAHTAVPIDLNLEVADPDTVDDKEMQFSDSYWEMQEEAEREEMEHLQEARMHRQNRGYYIGLDN